MHTHTYKGTGICIYMISGLESWAIYWHAGASQPWSYTCHDFYFLLCTSRVLPWKGFVRAHGLDRTSSSVSGAYNYSQLQVYEDYYA